MKVVLGKKEYGILPITIEQYELLKDNKDIKATELITMMTGAPIEEVKQAPFTQVSFVAKMLMNEWSNTETTPLNLVVDFKGVKYGLIKPSQISYEEWINLEVFMAESPLDLTKLAVHLYKPLSNDKIGEDRELIPYSLDECMGRVNDFRQFPITNLFSALFFLTTFVQELMKVSLSSMETKMIENKIKDKAKPKILRQNKSNNP
jgi:hypothetical protein